MKRLETQQKRFSSFNQLGERTLWDRFKFQSTKFAVNFLECLLFKW